jgi:hypothetical protein
VRAGETAQAYLPLGTWAQLAAAAAATPAVTLLLLLRRRGLARPADSEATSGTAVRTLPRSSFCSGRRVVCVPASPPSSPPQLPIEMRQRAERGGRVATRRTTDARPCTLN